MSTKTTDTHSEMLLALYRLSLESSIKDFQGAALELVGTQLKFDSAMWGTATHTPIGIDIHTIHLHKQPVEMLQAYELVKDLDTAAVAVSKNTSSTLFFNASEWFSDQAQQPLLEYGKRFDQRNFFITSTLNPQTRFTHWISLFRAHPEARGTEQERLLLGVLTPHLQQALEQNRVLHLARMGTLRLELRGSAIADRRGLVYHSDEMFEKAIMAEWTSWALPSLPQPLFEHFASGHKQFCGRSGVFTCRVERDLLFVRARVRCRADDLTSKEYAVALLIAKGKTYKEVAQKLGRAPATIRNQIQAIYHKLEVGNVAALIEQLQLTVD